MVSAYGTGMVVVGRVVVSVSINSPRVVVMSATVDVVEDTDVDTFDTDVQGDWVVNKIALQTYKQLKILQNRYILWNQILILRATRYGYFVAKWQFMGTFGGFFVHFWFYIFHLATL